MITIKRLFKDYGDCRLSLNKLEKEVTPWSDENADTFLRIKAKIYTLRINAKEYKSKNEINMARAKLIYESSFDMEDEINDLALPPEED